MKDKNKPAARWQLLLGSVGILAFVLACAVVSGEANPVFTGTPGYEETALHLEDGVIEVQDENGEWIPVSGDSSFDLTAELESVDPWMVAGISIETNETTQIEEELQAGDLVRVRGFILEDGTWLAKSIERAEEQIDPIIILIGRVDSVDPWVVNGIELNVTEDTVIQGTINLGTFVRVEILLSADGTWEVLSIAPLGDVEGDADCETVVAIVLQVDGNELELSGWPTVTLDGDIQIETGSNGDGTFTPGQTVFVVVCPSGEGQIVIVQIIVLNIEDEGSPGEGGEKVLICHKPEKKGGHTISISSSAVPAHLAHGDKLGSCP